MNSNSTLKAICRFVHFLSLFGLGAYMASDTSAPTSKNYGFIGHISGIGLVISGLLNYILLRKFKTDQNNTIFRKWVIGVHSK